MSRSGGAPRLVAVVVTLGLAGGCMSDRGSDEVEFRVPVSVAEVEVAPVEDRIVATGTLRSAEVVSLTADTAGVLEIARSDGRRLTEGDRVRAGDEIARITGEETRLAARTDATRQRFEAAERDLQATRELFDKGLITETELEGAETAYEEARLESDRSRHTERRTRLVTPIDGVILELPRDEMGRPLADGQLVAPGLVVARVAPTDRLVADVDVVGEDVGRIEAGQPARVRHHAFAARAFEGEVARLAPSVDPVTRAMRAEVEVDNEAGLLRPGMFVEVTVVVERRDGVAVVPRDAVTDRGGQRVVFVLRGQRVVQRPVELGLGDDDRVEVRGGLDPGERVVVRGLETLTDQTRVRVSG